MYLKYRFPSLSPPHVGESPEIFLDTSGQDSADTVSQSRRSVEQILLALDLGLDFTIEHGIDPKEAPSY